MNFPIQACSTCGEQTENMICSTCRRKLNRDEIKVFWNSQSWAQYRATVLDFKNYTASMPHLETRVLDAPPMDEEEPPAPVVARRRSMVWALALVAVALVLLALWLSGVFGSSSGKGGGTAGDDKTSRVETGEGGKQRGPRVAYVPGRTPPKNGGTGKTAKPKEPDGYGNPEAAERQAIEEMCGFANDSTDMDMQAEILPYEIEEACAEAQGTSAQNLPPAYHFDPKEIEEVCSAEAGIEPGHQENNSVDPVDRDEACGVVMNP